MARTLVTGSTGFVGGRLVATLLAQGHEVRCLVRPSSRRDTLAALGVTDFAQGDVGDPASLTAAVQGVEVVYHAAAFLRAPWMPEFRQINVDGVAHVARACAARTSPPTLVVVSSTAAAGPNSGACPRVESERPAPISVYGQCKLDGEREARKLANAVSISIVRPPGVFGPGDPYMPRMFDLVRRGLHVIPGDPRAQMSMIHVDDLANALILIAQRGERTGQAEDGTGAGVYHVAHPEPTSLRDLGLRAARRLGVDAPTIIPLPYPLMWIAAALGEGLGRLQHRPALLNLDKLREAWAGDWVCDSRKILRLGLAFGGTFAERFDQTVDAWAAP